MSERYVLAGATSTELRRRIGGLTGEGIRHGRVSLSRLGKSFVALPIYLVVLPFALLLKTHIWMASLAKVTYHLGCILGFCGLAIIRNRDD